MPVDFMIRTHKSNPQINYVGTQDQGYQRSLADGGGEMTYTQEISGDYAHIVSSDSGNTIWMVYPGFTMLILNASTANAEIKSLDFNGSEPLWLPPTMADPLNPYTCYIAGGHQGTGGSRMPKIDYNGTGLEESELPKNFATQNSGNISAMASSPINPYYWYVLTTEGVFYRSTDAGVTWTRKEISNGPGAHYFHGSSIFSSENTLGKVYISGSGYSNDGVWVSNDNGANFTSIQGNLPHTMVYSIAGDLSDSLIFAATEVGPYAYVVSDSTWYHLGNGKAPVQTYWSIEYVAATNTARFGTYGRGMWDFELQGSAAIGISEVEESSLKVYPNPASSNVTIERTKGSSWISIYDLKGVEVRRARFEDSKLTLDVSDLPSGIYIVKTEEGNTRLIID